MAVSEISRELASHGVSTAARNLNNSVADALRTPKAILEFARLDFNDKHERLWALLDWPEAENAVPVPVPKKKVSQRRSGEHADRTLAGLIAARARGVRFGPPEKITDEKLVEVQRMIADGVSIREIAGRIGVSASGIYMRLRRARAKNTSAPSSSAKSSSMKN